MMIAVHGGGCCGVKHIWGLGLAPSGTAYPSTATPMPVGVYVADHSRHNQDLFREAAPKESNGQRFSRLLKWIKKNRPYGIVEVVISTGEYDGMNQKAWIPFLEEARVQRSLGVFQQQLKKPYPRISQVS
jgi:hypothetical protein